MKIDGYYLKMYRKNEASNNHSENLLMLADLFGNRVERRLAKMNWQRRMRLGYADFKLNALANRHVGKYYARLIAS